MDRLQRIRPIRNYTYVGYSLERSIRMMRSHGTEAPREIYQFGKKGEPIYDAIEKAIRLRYSLLPYIYSTSWQVTNKQSSFFCVR